MRKYCRTKLTHQSVARRLLQAFGEATVDRIARRCGFLRRKREIAPLSLLCACVSTLAVGKAYWLADILRTFNELTGKSVRYKPFHNQLSKPAFAEFTRLMLNVVLQKLTMPVLEALPQHKLAMFTDIVLHDGTSFALKDTLVRIFPGRFTKVSPAAVELHVTMSALEDNANTIILAPDKETERAFSPTPENLEGSLLLEDRGYEGRKEFIAINQAGGFFIIRGNTTIKPTIIEARDAKGRRLRRLEGKRLQLKKLPPQSTDLEIEWGRGSQRWRGRLVVLYRRGKRHRKLFTLLHTNLSRTVFSAAEIGQLYRLRWQIELLFKEWKSHANLHRFDTSKAAIAEGLIWASLLAATLKRYLTHAGEQLLHVELSTQRVAKAARHFLDNILKSLLRGARSLPRVLARAFTYMRDNTRRAHPARDRQKGRLAIGLRPIALP